MVISSGFYEQPDLPCWKVMIFLSIEIFFLKWVCIVNLVSLFSVNRMAKFIVFILVCLLVSTQCFNKSLFYLSLAVFNHWTYSKYGIFERNRNNDSRKRLG